MFTSNSKTSVSFPVINQHLCRSRVTYKANRLNEGSLGIHTICDQPPDGSSDRKVMMRTSWNRLSDTSCFSYEMNDPSNRLCKLCSPCLRYWLWNVWCCILVLLFLIKTCFVPRNTGSFLNNQTDCYSMRFLLNSAPNWSFFWTRSTQK